MERGSIIPRIYILGLHICYFTYCINSQFLFLARASRSFHGSKKKSDMESSHLQYLVGGTPIPLWKLWVRQLGLFFPIYRILANGKDYPNIWKVIKFHGSKPPTRYGMKYGLWIVNHGSNSPKSFRCRATKLPCLLPEPRHGEQLVVSW